MTHYTLNQYENVKGEWKQTDKYVDEFLSKKLKSHPIRVRGSNLDIKREFYDTVFQVDIYATTIPMVNNIYKTVFRSEGKTDAEAERLAKQLTKDTDEFIKTRGTWIHQIISDVLNGEKAIRTDSTNPELYTVNEELKKEIK